MGVDPGGSDSVSAVNGDEGGRGISDGTGQGVETTPINGGKTKKMTLTEEVLQILYGNAEDEEETDEEENEKELNEKTVNHSSMIESGTKHYENDSDEDRLNQKKEIKQSFCSTDNNETANVENVSTVIRENHEYRMSELHAQAGDKTRNRQSALKDNVDVNDRDVEEEFDESFRRKRRPADVTDVRDLPTMTKEFLKEVRYMRAGVQILVGDRFV